MGRKIPGAKHHGVKDPVKQLAQRMKILKQKINAPPSNPDEQPIPKSLTRLFEYKEKQEQRLKAKKTPKTHKEKFNNVSQSSANPVSSLNRLPGESGRSFNQRINSALHSINKRHLQTHEMEKSLNPDNYLPEENTKEERLDFIQNKKLKRKLKGEKARKAEGGEAPAKLSRMQRWTIKKKEKKAEKLQEQDDSRFEPRYERVAFGEIAHEPPSLHIKPKKANTADGAPRPGRRDLLLNKLLNKQVTPESTRTKPRVTVSVKPTSADRKGKRKSLPAGVRMRLEQAQREAVAAYRTIKINSMKSKH